MARAKRLTGLNPLAYMGVEAETPSQFTIQQRDPTPRDFSNWNIGAIWLTQNTESIWILVAKQAGVATWIKLCAVELVVETLTADTGGAVGPDVNNNIFLVSAFAPLTFDGDPSTFTLTLNSDGTLADSYPTDSGTAVPAGGVLNILGGTGVDTSGAGSTVTIAVDATVATQYDADAGSAVPAANILNIVGGTGLTTTGAGSTITVAPTGEIATSYVTDSGTATPAASVLNILGGLTANTAGAGDTVTFNIDSLGGPGIVVTDVGGVYSSINGTDGQVIIAATGADPIWANITSTDASITITGGPNTLDLSVASVGTVTAGDNINISGGDTVNLNETIHWPDTNAGGTTGMIYLGGSGGAGGDRFLHNFTAGGPEQNTFIGTNSGNLTLTNDGHTGIGENTLSSLTGGTDFVAIGNNAFLTMAAATGGVAVGVDAFRVAIQAEGTAIGYKAGELVTSGLNNSFFGAHAGDNITTGDDNMIIGYQAGTACTLDDSDNIIIGNAGVVGDNKVIRIGTDGTGDGQQDKCYIAGINGVTVSGGIAVLVNSDGKLGTTTSSIRYKENIGSLDNYSSRLFDLNPVSFTYKSDDTHEKQYGLIAEEVEKVLPEIVVYKDDAPDAVQYHHIVPMLLNEFQKLSGRLKDLEVLASSRRSGA